MKTISRITLMVLVLAMGFSACKSNQKTIKKGKPIPCPQKDC